MNDNLRDPARQPLPRSYVKRYTGPSPILDREFNCSKRVGRGVWRNIGFLVISGYGLAIHHSRIILATHGRTQYPFGAEWKNRAKNLFLFITHRVCFERNGRLHGGKRKQLKEVIRYHVTECAGAFIIPSTLLNPHGFCGSDLNMVNILPVPNRLENTVAKSERHNILYRFFPEIVINSVNLVLIEHFFELLIQGTGRLVIMPKGFLNDHTPPMSILFADEVTRS